MRRSSPPTASSSSCRSTLRRSSSPATPKPLWAGRRSGERAQKSAQAAPGRGGECPGARRPGAEAGSRRRCGAGRRRRDDRDRLLLRGLRGRADDLFGRKSDLPRALQVREEDRIPAQARRSREPSARNARSRRGRSRCGSTSRCRESRPRRPWSKATWPAVPTRRLVVRVDAESRATAQLELGGTASRPIRRDARGRQSCGVPSSASCGMSSSAGPTATTSA